MIAQRPRIRHSLEEECSFNILVCSSLLTGDILHHLPTHDVILPCFVSRRYLQPKP